jgi:thiamine kinase-like enzyme
MEDHMQAEKLDTIYMLWKRELGLAEIRPLPPVSGSRNQHFVGIRAGEEQPSCFLKLLIKEVAYQREVAASKVLASLGYQAQTLLGHGEIGDGQYWLALPWLDCEDLKEPTDEEVLEAARIIGTLHRQTIRLEAPEMRNVSLNSELTRQFDGLKDISPELHDKLLQRLDHLRQVAGEWETYEQTLPHCLLQGDFGWRNFVREKSGNLLLIDFELSMMGPCWMEFAKALNREFADRQRQQLFINEYQATVGASLPDLADHFAWAMRLWQVAGIFVYTEKYGDPTGFRKYGLSIVEAFDRKWSF